MTNIYTTNWTESEGNNPLVLFQNHLTDSTPSVSDADSALTESTYDSWSFTLDQTVTFDLGTALNYNSFAIVGAKDVGSVQLLTSTDNTTFTAINATATLVPNSDCSLFVFNQRTTRYFRVIFTGTGTGSVRSLWLSKAFEFPGGVGYNYTPPWMAQEKELLVSKTLNGQFVGNRVVSKGAMTMIPMIAEERTFVEDDLQPFMQHYNEGRPFIWAAGPTVFTKDTAYVWRQQDSEMKPTFDQSGNWMSFSMAVEGYVT